jgi:hypothetical protein
VQDLTAIARGIDLLEQLHEEISANALREDNRIGARLARAVTYQAPMPAICAIRPVTTSAPTPFISIFMSDHVRWRAERLG